jgi:hypothetical protein
MKTIAGACEHIMNVFIYDLFNDAVSSSEYIVLSDELISE